MVVGTGEAVCGGCGFEYTPKVGEEETGEGERGAEVWRRSGPRHGGDGLARVAAAAVASPGKLQRARRPPAGPWRRRLAPTLRPPPSPSQAGDPEYPVPPGTQFQDLPGDWGCPVCGAGKATFRARAREIAGFAENQRYGLGTNSMTSGQKSGLIYGMMRDGREVRGGGGWARAAAARRVARGGRAGGSSSTKPPSWRGKPQPLCPPPPPPPPPLSSGALAAFFALFICGYFIN